MNIYAQTPPYYFHYSYTNYAMGKQHQGWIIDNEGNVRTYTMPEKWNLPDNNHITTEQMQENLNLANSVAFKINMETLNKYIELMKDASYSPITDPKSARFDAGEVAFSGYIWDASERKYKEILIEQTGDYEAKNTSPKAKIIMEWFHNDLKNETKTIWYSN